MVRSIDVLTALRTWIALGGGGGDRRGGQNNGEEEGFHCMSWMPTAGGKSSNEGVTFPMPVVLADCQAFPAALSSSGARQCGCRCHGIKSSLANHSHSGMRRPARETMACQSACSSPASY